MVGEPIRPAQRFRLVVSTGVYPARLFRSVGAIEATSEPTGAELDPVRDLQYDFGQRPQVFVAANSGAIWGVAYVCFGSLVSPGGCAALVAHDRGWQRRSRGFGPHVRHPGSPAHLQVMRRL